MQQLPDTRCARHLHLTLPSYTIPSRDTNQIFKTNNGEEKKKREKVCSVEGEMHSMAMRGSTICPLVLLVKVNVWEVKVG
jgi:hypothetical protein